MPNRRLALPLILGATLVATGCPESSAEECISIVEVDLDVLGILIDVDGVDVEINEVTWTISGNGMAPMSGAIDAERRGVRPDTG